MIQAILRKTQAATKNTSYAFKQSVNHRKPKAMLVIKHYTAKTQAMLQTQATPLKHSQCSTSCTTQHSTTRARPIID